MTGKKLKKSMFYGPTDPDFLKKKCKINCFSGNNFFEKNASEASRIFLNFTVFFFVSLGKLEYNASEASKKI